MQISQGFRKYQWDIVGVARHVHALFSTRKAIGQVRLSLSLSLSLSLIHIEEHVGGGRSLTYVPDRSMPRACLALSRHARV